MKDELKRKMDELIKEEQKTAVDSEFLDKLNILAASEPLYTQFTPEERNTLNEFFREVRNYLFQELLSGVYGAQVIIDAIIVLCFEVGYKLKKSEVQPPPPP
jgi:hypothetical protein